MSTFDGVVPGEFIYLPSNLFYANANDASTPSANNLEEFPDISSKHHPTACHHSYYYYHDHDYDYDCR